MKMNILDVNNKAIFYKSNQFRASKVRWILRSLILLACLALALPVMAAWTQNQQITSTPRGIAAQHGNAVAIYGIRMVVGAQHDPTTALNAGAVFVYRASGGVWIQEAKLLASDGMADDQFGYSVAIYHDTIVVGANQANASLPNSGAAYVFSYDRFNLTWVQQQKLTANDGGSDDQFGNAVGIDGEVLVVGSHFNDRPIPSSAGAVYVFRRSGTVWTQVQKLVSTAGPFGVFGNYFGESIAFRGGKIVIGATGDNTPETAAGSVYVFVESNGLYVLQQKITIPDGSNGDNFGCSVAIEGNTLIGGAREDSTIVGQHAFGAAYVYEFNGTSWVSQGKLVASDGALTDRFGWSVAVTGNVIAVGARGADTALGVDSGAAYMFTRFGTTWTQVQKLALTDSSPSARFGSSIALTSDANLIVGASDKALTAPVGQGAVYYFTQPAPKVKFDFDGDGKADISIFRPISGQWWYQQSLDNSVRALTFGTSTDKPVPADFDGDGKTDIAVYRPARGEWFVLRSSNNSFFSVPFGNSTDKPAPGDFDGDGLADFAVFRPSEGTWYINKSSGGTQITQWGGEGDIPVTADYDGDGKSDFAIFRPSNGQWWLNRSMAGNLALTFGISTDKPVPADYTGDGKTDIAVWRPSNGTWFVLRSEDSSFFAIPFGASSDIPAPADYDGDAKADVAIFRPDGANWFIQRSTAGILIQQFGATGDLPTQAAFVP